MRWSLTNRPWAMDSIYLNGKILVLAVVNSQIWVAVGSGALPHSLPFISMLSLLPDLQTSSETVYLSGKPEPESTLYLKR